MSLPSITLTRSEVDPTVFLNLPTWRFTVTALSNDETQISSKIFCYSATMHDDNYEGDVFTNVCSVQELDSLPPDVPYTAAGTQCIPYYRTSTATINCDSLTQANDTWQKLVGDVNDLVSDVMSFQILGSNTVIVMCPGDQW